MERRSRPAAPRVRLPEKHVRVEVRIGGLWVAGVVENTSMSHASALEEHTVVLDGGGTMYVKLRAKRRWDYVRREGEAAHEARLNAAMALAEAKAEAKAAEPRVIIDVE